MFLVFPPNKGNHSLGLPERFNPPFSAMIGVPGFSVSKVTIVLLLAKKFLEGRIIEGYICALWARDFRQLPHF